MPRAPGHPIRRFALCLALTLTRAPLAKAEPGTELRFRHLSLEEGLSHPDVYSITQDATGFPWFATAAGLDRYDGYSIDGFDQLRSTGARMAAEDVSVLLRDSKGDLWVGTWGHGLFHVAYPELVVTGYRHDPSVPASLPDDRVQALLEDHAGRIWLATFRGLAVLDSKTGAFQSFDLEPDEPRTSIRRAWALAEGPDESLWVATHGAIARLAANRREISYVPTDPLGSPPFRALLFDDKGRLWVGSESGLVRMTPASGKTEKVRLGPGHDPPVNTLFEDRRSTIWVGTLLGGLHRIEPATDRIDVFRTDPSNPRSIASNDVRSLYEDDSDILWIGTRGGGVDSVDLRPPRFRRVDSPAVLDVMENATGELWLATEQGIVQNDPRAQRQVVLYRAEPDDPDGLSEVPTTLVRDPRGRVWIGTRSGLDRLETNGTFRHYRNDPLNPKSVPARRVWDLMVDRDGRLWVGTEGGLARFEEDPDRFVRYHNEPDEPDSLSDNFVRVLLESRDGALWVGTDAGGLNRFDPTTDRFQSFLHDPDDPRSLADNRVTALYERRDGALWVGNDAGVDRLDVERSGFEYFGPERGFPAHVMALLEDDEGSLWVSSTSGLTRYEPATGHVHTFDTADGLQSRVFSPGAAIRTTQGELVFGGYEGFNRFRPDTPIPESEPPRIALTRFTVFNRPYDLGKALADVDTIELSEQDWYLGFEFAALDFRDPARNRYSVMLENHDPEWRELGSRHYVEYTQVPPGRYTFHVRAANSDGVWNEEGLKLALVITPPFYNSFWFRSAALAAALLSVLLVHRLRIQSLENRRSELEAKVDERTAEVETQRQELEVAYRRLEEISLSDPLTGLGNRRCLTEAMERDVATSLRRHAEGRPEASDLVFLMLDLDHFKEVNDSHGHVGGDVVLVELALLLGRLGRASDLLIRWGGEEFLVVARFVDRAAARDVAERIRRAVEAHAFDLGDSQSLKQTCSIGYAAFPFILDEPAAISWQDVIAIADQALYTAKRSGRNASVGLEAANDADPEGFMERMREGIEAMIERGELRREGPAPSSHD